MRENSDANGNGAAAERDSQSRERLIERLLEDALCEIAAVEPPRGLEHRVMARIRGADILHRDSARPSASWWRMGSRFRLAAAAALLALAVSGWVLWREPEHAGRDAPRQREMQVNAGIRRSPDVATRNVPPPSRAPRRPATRREPARTPAPMLPPAERLEPLAIQALRSPPLAVESIELTPLPTEIPLQIIPLSASADAESKEQK